MLDGIHIAGKTGTTNAHRDAWFVAFTGNLVAGVWFGNDDYQSMQKMTGGSLPAMTWNAVMSYAHKGIELKNIPGIAPNPPPGTTPQSQAVAASAPTDTPARPAVLTQRGARVLLNLERLMDDASRALSVAGAPTSPAPSAPSTGQQTSAPATETYASASSTTNGAAVSKN